MNERTAQFVSVRIDRRIRIDCKTRGTDFALKLFSWRPELGPSERIPARTISEQKEFSQE